MKNVALFFLFALMVHSCNTSKNKEGKFNMVESDNYTLNIEAIMNNMPTLDATVRDIYAIINITAQSKHEFQWKFEQAIVSNEKESYTLSSFDHSTYFEKGQMHIMTNLREIPNDIGQEFDIEITLIDEENNKLVMHQKGVKVMQVE